MKPLVSVIMPAYNGEKYIGAAIESILNQTYDNWELLIIEDQSTDGTMKVIQAYTDPRIRVFQNPQNRGIAYSTNLGIDESRGKYIALLDDDDLAAEQRLEWQSEYMEAHEAVDILGGRSANIDENGSFLGYDWEPLHNSRLIKSYLLFYMRLFTDCSMMCRKAFLEKHGIRYEENSHGLHDVKFNMVCSKLGTITSVDRLACYKRAHGDKETYRQLTIHAKERAEVFARFQRESLEAGGFSLTEEQLQTINELIPETVGGISRSVEDIRRLHQVLKEIIRQAREMEIDYLPELEYACKRALTDKCLMRSNIFD